MYPPQGDKNLCIQFCWEGLNFKNLSVGGQYGRIAEHRETCKRMMSKKGRQNFGQEVSASTQGKS